MREEREEEGFLRQLVIRYNKMISEGRSNEYFDLHEVEELVNYYIEKYDFDNAEAVLLYGLNIHGVSERLELLRSYLMASRGDYEGAAKIIEGIGDKVFYDTDLYYIKGDIYKILGNSYAAIREYKKALLNEKGSDSGDVYMLIGIEYKDIGDYDNAIIYLKKALETGFDDRELFYQLALCYSIIGELEESLNYYKKYINNDVLNSFAWYELGLLYMRQGNYDMAIESFDYAILLDNKFEDAYIEKANTLMLKKDYSGSISVIDCLLEIENNNAVGYVYKGMCSEKMGNYIRAICYYNEALKIDKYSSEALVGLGVCYGYLGDYENAILTVKRGIKYDNINTDYWIILGNLYLKQGNYRKARLAYKKSGICKELVDNSAIIDSIEDVEYEEDYRNRWWILYANSYIKEGKVKGAVLFLMKLLKNEDDRYIKGLYYIRLGYYKFLMEDIKGFHYNVHIGLSLLESTGAKEIFKVIYEAKENTNLYLMIKSLIN